MTPPARDATASKQRILNAAFTEFTDRGFAGARIDEIAGRAGCNKALVYHYFEDKGDLFRCVLEAKLAELTDLDTLAQQPDRIAEVAGEVFDFHAANPEYTRLLMWEALDFGREKTVPNEEQRGDRLRKHVETLERLQGAGLIDRTLDMRHALITLMGVVLHWFAFPQTARMVYREDPYTNEALKERRAHVIEMARRILEVG